MKKVLIIINNDAYCTDSNLILFQIIKILKSYVSEDIAFIKPVIKNNKDIIYNQYIISMLKLKLNCHNTYILTKKELYDLFIFHKIDNLLLNILACLNNITNDLIVIDNLNVFNNIFFDLNIYTAVQLNMSCILFITGENRSIEKIINIIIFQNNILNNKNLYIDFVIIFNTNINYDDLIKQLRLKFVDYKFLIFIINNKDVFCNFRIKDVNNILSSKIIYNNIDLINLPMKRFILYSFNIKNLLNNAKDVNILYFISNKEFHYVYNLFNYLSDIKINSLTFIISEMDIILDNFLCNIHNLNINFMLSFIFVKKNYFYTWFKLFPFINLSNYMNNDLLLNDKNRYFFSSNNNTKNITAVIFKNNIISKSKFLQKHIVLPEGHDERILIAGSKFVFDGLGRITYLGHRHTIKKIIKSKNIYWNDDKMKIIDPVKSSMYTDFYHTFYNIRKNKGLTLKNSKDIMKDASYFGTMMIYKDLADGMVSGAVNTTSNTIRPALQFIKTKKNIKNVSSVFFMLLEKKVLIYADCAIIPNPDFQELSEIAFLSYKTAKNFDIDPIIAMLSYSSGDSGHGIDVDKVKQATLLVKKKYPYISIEGPIQYDAAVNKDVGKHKLPNSILAGKANVLIFPDLNSGNNTYKAVQRETNCLAIGPIIQGLNKPINDLSRGAKIEDIYNTIIVTSIQSNH